MTTTRKSLVAALAIGVAVSWSQQPELLSAVSIVEPIGALWVNAIRMTVIPLVVSLLITGIASGSARSVGRDRGLSCPWRRSTAPPSPPSANRFPALETELPLVRDWIVGLIPANPVRAAADGAMLPLVVFAAILGLAVTRTETAYRETLVHFFDAIARAMFVIVEWILAVAPVGVFFLVLPLAARTGADIVGAFGVYLLVACGLICVALGALYPLVVVAGGVPLRQFAGACAPAQAVGFSTRSSLAALPALLDTAERDLGLPNQVSGVVLPLAVSVFKFASPVARITGTFFVARLYGIDLNVGEIAVIAAAVAALSFYSPGIPSGGLFVLTPIYIALNLPVEGVGLLIALDMIPDMFITTANVTGNMAVAVLVSRWGGSEGDG